MNNYLHCKETMTEARWGMCIISALGRQKEEDCEFKARLSYIVRPCLK
jgi:hypothetical protein